MRGEDVTIVTDRLHTDDLFDICEHECCNERRSHMNVGMINGNPRQLSQKAGSFVFGGDFSLEVTED